jgi:hypothetical protein
MDLFSLLDRVKKAIYDNPDTPHQPANDPGGLIGEIEKLFGQVGQNNGDRTVLPSSRDPYGDPADQNFGNVRPASEDSYGDPANQNFGNVRPASEDPLGDPGR